MAELLKDQYYLWSFYEKLGEALESQLPDFDRAHLLKKVADQKIIELDLKTKMYESARLMHQFLPHAYENQLGIVLKLGPVFGGLEGMFLPAWVELFGLDNPAASVQGLYELTKHSSAEFSIRPFIIQDQSLVLKEMLTWSRDENEHVRRLASEGCRPRLPWAMAISELKRDPEPIFPILDELKADESLYVRKSVANNINDITKDNPDLALDLVEGWGFGQHKHTDWIIKHGLRSLIKAGNQRALKLLGFEPPKVSIDKFQLANNQVKIGDNLNMKLTLINKGKDATLMLDYTVHFVRAKGKMGKKVFKWKNFALKAEESIVLSKSHSFKLINTRRYYPGTHKVEVQVNGEIVTFEEFQLLDV